MSTLIQLQHIELPKTIFGPIYIIEGNGVNIRATGSTPQEAKSKAMLELKELHL